MMQNSLYIGHVYHKRHQPFEHEFRYRVFTMLVDIDDLDALDQRLKIFSFNRWNILSLFNKDHAKRDGSAIRPWIENAAKDKNIDVSGKIFMLTFPRLWGYIFNPITVYFCTNKSDQITAVLHEVKNTFGEQHGYLLPVEEMDKGTIKQSCDKIFHVSPFIQMDCDYNFEFRAPQEILDFAIHQFQTDDQGKRSKILTATWDGQRRDLTDLELFKALLTHPLMSFKIILAIHWEALWLWNKGAKYIKRPPLPQSDVS